MSLSSKAANMLLARCRARYGKRLTAQDIEALVGCRTVPDCAAYLRNTRYADSVRVLSEGNMRRRPFEAALNEHLLRELHALCRCEQSVGDWFSDYIIMQAETRVILAFLRLLSAGRQREMVLTVPEHVLQRTGIESERLPACEDYDDFLQAVRHSHFAKVLRARRPLPGNRPDCALIEQSLQSEFYSEIIRLIHRHSGSVKDELMDIIGTRIDMENLRYVWRLKKYYSADPAAIRSMLSGQYHLASRRVVREMTEAPTAEDALRIFRERTPYGRQLDSELLESPGGPEAAAQLLIYNRARRLMRSSVNPSTVLLAYITVTEAEVRDLSTIVEGVFYNLPREEILSLITINRLAG